MKVLGGDWPAGAVFLKKSFFGGEVKAIRLSRGWAFDTIPLDQIAFADIVTQENQASIGRALGWGAAGAVALGPLGLLAGVFGGSRKSVVILAMKFRDGRSVLLQGKLKEFTPFIGAAFTTATKTRSEPLAEPAALTVDSAEPVAIRTVEPATVQTKDRPKRPYNKPSVLLFGMILGGIVGNFIVPAPNTTLWFPGALAGGILFWVLTKLADRLTRAEVYAPPEALRHEQPGGSFTPAVGAESVTDQLKALGELRQAGVLTDEEFVAKKTDLLARL